MGQQQLLLLVLGVVLVGLAVVVGISAFEEHKAKAQVDVYTEQAVRIASQAIAWKAQPQASGGGQGVYALSGLTLGDLGFSNVVARACGNGQCQEAQTSNGDYVFLWDQNSAYAHMGVADASFATDASLLDVAVFVYGPSLDCLRTRVRTRSLAGAAWTETVTPDGSTGSPPATCTTPW